MTTSTLLRRRIDAARNLDSRLYAQREAAIERLARIDGKLKANRKSVARLDRRLKAKVEVELAASQAPAPLPADPVEPGAPKVTTTNLQIRDMTDDELMPAFLDRRNLLPDPKTKDRNAERRAVEREKREAKLTGKTKRMPLTGKAALDAIRNG